MGGGHRPETSAEGSREGCQDRAPKRSTNSWGISLVRHGYRASWDDHLQVFAVELGAHLGEERIIPEGDPLLEVTCRRGRPHAGGTHRARITRRSRLLMGFELQIRHAPVSGARQNSMKK